MSSTSRRATLILRSLLLTLIIAPSVAATQPAGLALDAEAQALLREEPRELTVLTQTLAGEELDRAVLNRLLLEIETDPESVRQRLGVDAETLGGLAITISNARHFINNNEMAYIRAMCGAWRKSALRGEARIAEALAAYRARQQITLNFIARYYRMVIADIEAILDAPASQQFHAYLDDGRRRLANAGTVVPGVTTQNIQSGREAVQFHCRGRPGSE